MPKYLTSGQRKRMQARKQGKKKYTRPPARKKKAYPSARGNYVPKAYNVETKIIELPPQSTNLTNNDASDTRPKNTLVLLPATWQVNTHEQHPRVNAIDGLWATPCYINQKFRLSFDKLVADHVDSAEGFTLKMHIGRLKITPSKFGARTDLFSSYVADCEAQVYKELAESDFDSDFLEYSKRNRNIEIISTKNIVPNRNGSFRKAILPAQGQGQGETFTAPPPIERAVNHKIAKLKTRVTTVDMPATQTGATYTMFDNLWVPFVAFSCNQLTANTGYIHVEHSSRLYFQDM